MKRRRDPVDPFGLSLLDVLSNALGGVILLTLIVAATIKGNDERNLNEPDDAYEGERYTSTFFKQKEKEKLEFNLLLCQFKLEGKNVDQVQLKLEGVYEVCGCSTGKQSTLNQMDKQINTGRQVSWLAMRTKPCKGEWKVQMIAPPQVQIKSVSIFISSDAEIICSRKLDSVEARKLFLRIQEEGEDSPSIYINGSDECP